MLHSDNFEIINAISRMQNFLITQLSNGTIFLHKNAKFWGVSHQTVFMMKAIKFEA